MRDQKTQDAFNAMMRDHVMVQALSDPHAPGRLQLILEFAFMAGAKYAADRCAAENHGRK